MGGSGWWCSILRCVNVCQRISEITLRCHQTWLAGEGTRNLHSAQGFSSKPCLSTRGYPKLRKSQNISHENQRHTEIIEISDIRSLFKEVLCLKEKYGSRNLWIWDDLDCEIQGNIQPWNRFQQTHLSLSSGHIASRCDRAGTPLGLVILETAGLLCPTFILARSSGTLPWQS